MRVVPLARNVLQRNGQEQAAVERRALLPVTPRIPEPRGVPRRTRPVDEAILQTNRTGKMIG